MEEMTRRNATKAVNGSQAAARLREEALQLETLIGRLRADEDETPNQRPSSAA
jgi:hypothetical protein